MGFVLFVGMGCVCWVGLLCVSCFAYFLVLFYMFCLWFVVAVIYTFAFGVAWGSF